MDKNEVTNRFLSVLSKLYKTDAEFLKGTEISKQQLSNLRRGQNATLPMIITLGMKNSDVSLDYILTGRGSMFLDKNDNVPNSNGTAITTEEEFSDAKNKGLKLLPEINFQFAAGQKELINDRESVNRYWYLPDCKDCECVVQVVGNSMQPTFPSGCFVALKKYSLPTGNPNTIPFGNVFGIVVEDKDTGDYHGHIKILRRYKDANLAAKYWIAQSINPDFDDFDIEIAQVRSLWIVKEHIVIDAL